MASFSDLGVAGVDKRMLVESGHDSWFMNFSDNGDKNVDIVQEDNWNESEKVVEEVNYDNVAQQRCTVGMAHHAHITQGIKNTTYQTI